MTPPFRQGTRSIISPNDATGEVQGEHNPGVQITEQGAGAGVASQIGDPGCLFLPSSGLSSRRCANSSSAGQSGARCALACAPSMSHATRLAFMVAGQAFASSVVADRVSLAVFRARYVSS